MIVMATVICLLLPPAVRKLIVFVPLLLMVSFGFIVWRTGV
jgi:hypothetical protein